LIHNHEEKFACFGCEKWGDSNLFRTREALYCTESYQKSGNDLVQFHSLQLDLRFIIRIQLSNLNRSQITHFDSTMPLVEESLKSAAERKSLRDSFL
jgi:hypothetical protein